MTQKPKPEREIGFGDTIVDEAYRLCIMATDDEGNLCLDKIADSLTDLRTRSIPKHDPSYEELVDFARWTQTFWKNGIEIMRKNGLVIKSDDPMEKLAFTFYSNLCEIDVKAAHLFNEWYGDKNYKDESAIQAQTITTYPKPYEERMRENVLEEIEKIVDGAISGLYKGTEDVISAHARHKAFSWVKMKIQELRKQRGGS